MPLDGLCQRLAVLLGALEEHIATLDIGADVGESQFGEQFAQALHLHHVAANIDTTQQGDIYHYALHYHTRPTNICAQPAGRRTHARRFIPRPALRCLSSPLPRTGEGLGVGTNLLSAAYVW